MKIAVIGWGSLLWDRKNLQIEDPKKKWFFDGPELPIEFMRQSKDGRITLVISSGLKKVQTFWKYSKYDNLNDAINNLVLREKTIDKNIGYVNLKHEKIRSQNKEVTEIIQQWAREKKLEGVIWTDLPPKPMNINLEWIESYLTTISDEKTKKKIKKYVLNTDPQIQTEYREKIEELLNEWN